MTKRAPQRPQDCSDAHLRDRGGPNVLKGISRAVAVRKARSEGTAARILGRLRAGNLADRFTRRDILQRGWSGLSSPEDVGAGLALLVELGVLTTFRLNARGRPKIVYRITPPGFLLTNFVRARGLTNASLGAKSAPPNGT